MICERRQEYVPRKRIKMHNGCRAQAREPGFLGIDIPGPPMTHSALISLRQEDNSRTSEYSECSV